MQNNSIIRNLTKEDMIADLRMILGADFNRKECALIVEGDDDLSFFAGKRSHDVYLYKSPSGKPGVKEIVESFTDSRVIGIQDRDYLEAPEHSQIHFYDYNCLEMMMVADNSTFENFCYTLYQGQFSPLELRSLIMKDLAPLSCYRKLNENRHWGIRFDGVNLGSLCNSVTGRIDYTLLEDRIKITNPQSVSDVHTQMQDAKDLSDTLSNLDEYLMITQGHDFLSYFHHLCLHSLSRQASFPKAKELGKSLQCAYRLSDFKESRLYQEIFVEQSSFNRVVFKT